MGYEDIVNKEEVSYEFECINIISKSNVTDEQENNKFNESEEELYQKKETLKNYINDSVTENYQINDIVNENEGRGGKEDNENRLALKEYIRPERIRKRNLKYLAYLLHYLFYNLKLLNVSRKHRKNILLVLEINKIKETYVSFHMKPM